MKGLVPLFIGLFGTFAFSWVGLTLIPNSQIGHLDPQSDEEGTDIYPMPRSGMVERGERIYIGNGCVYCHSQQLRPDYVASDIDRERDAAPSPRPKWGERRSAPRDYVFARPALLGKMRMGPDLANIGKAAPAEEESPAPAASPTAASPAPGGSPSPPAAKPAASASRSPAPANSPAATSTPSPSAGPAKPNPSPAAAAAPVVANASPPPAPESETKTGEPRPYSVAWHHRHLYSPRSINIDSNMPAYRFLYEKRLIDGERSADALQLTGSDAPPEGWEVIPTYDAQCLVAYLMSLDQSHPLKEVKSAAPAASPAGSPAASPGASPPPASPAASPPTTKGAK